MHYLIKMATLKSTHIYSVGHKLVSFSPPRPKRCVWTPLVLTNTHQHAQAGLRTNDLVNAAALAWPLTANDSLPTTTALHNAVQSFAPIVADAYSSAKQVLPGIVFSLLLVARSRSKCTTRCFFAPTRMCAHWESYRAPHTHTTCLQVLLRDEQIVLRLLRFELCVEHPYGHLFNLCEAVQATPQLATLATCLVRRSCCNVCAAALLLLALLRMLCMPFDHWYRRCC